MSILTIYRPDLSRVRSAEALVTLQRLHVGGLTSRHDPKDGKLISVVLGGNPCPGVPRRSSVPPPRACS